MHICTSTDSPPPGLPSPQKNRPPTHLRPVCPCTLQEPILTQHHINSCAARVGHQSARQDRERTNRLIIHHPPASSAVVNSAPQTIPISGLESYSDSYPEAPGEKFHESLVTAQNCMHMDGERDQSEQDCDHHNPQVQAQVQDLPKTRIICMHRLCTKHLPTTLGAKNLRTG